MPAENAGVGNFGNSARGSAWGGSSFLGHSQGHVIIFRGPQVAQVGQS